MSVQSALTLRISNAPRELKLFAIASLVMGMSYSMIDATFNNFLNERFSLNGFERSFLEFPRELPGLLTVFISALLWFLCSRRLGAVSMLMNMVGALLIGFASSSYAVMVIWLFIYSMGQHLFMPVASTVGMELAREGQTGKRLGQLNAIRNLAAIGGSFFIFIGFKFLGLSFQITFLLAAIGFGVVSILMFRMQPQETQRPATFLKLHKEYRLYYALAVLYGSRKQLFITFAPWVLVTIFHQRTEVLATLITLGGIIGILFQPLLGWAIDKLGERVVLMAEAIVLAIVCFGYGFSKIVFPEAIAFILVCVFYLLDQMSMSVSMARSTYMKKIARDPADIQPALTVAQTIDHVFSISVAIIGGLVWNFFGYQYVFLMGVGIAIINFFVATQVHIPKLQTGETNAIQKPVTL